MTGSRPNDEVSNARGALTSVPAPSTALASVIELAWENPSLRLRYVADRLVLTPESFLTYLQSRERDAREILPEAFAASVAEDIANEIVPKWLQVTFSAKSAVRHTVTVEDRQPGWDHPTLLRGL
ncbi:MAG: hypothetical protein ACXWNE_10120 [Candidatus Binataceae bacterium]